MLNALFGHGVAAAPSQLFNASVDDLALCLRCFGLVSDAIFAPYRRNALRRSFAEFLRRRIRIVSESNLRSRDLSDTADTRRVVQQITRRHRVAAKPPDALPNSGTALSRSAK